jgi:HEAT repeat protein
MPTIEEITKLKVGTVDEKLAVLETLDGRASAAELQLLLDALSDAKWAVRKRACDRLGELGAAILEPLERLLEEGSEDQKFWVMKALVALGRDAVPALIRALTRGEQATRVYGASALGEIGDPVAVPYLVQALGDPVWRVRRNAYESLLALGDAALPELTKSMAGANEDVAFWSAKALGKFGDKARGVLLSALKSGSHQLRFIIAAALGESGDTRIIKVLVKSLGEGAWITQKRSCDALAEIGPAALAPITEALVRARPPQDHWLMLAMSRMGPAGIEKLEEVLVAQGESFRWDKKDALTRIGEVLVPLYRRLFAQSEKDIRLFAVTCAGELLTSRPADDLLLSALSDRSWTIRKVAAERLAERGPAVLDRLAVALETGDEDLRYWVTVIFRKMGDPGLPHLVRALADPNTNIAYFASRALGGVRNREAVRPLIQALKAPSWPVRKNASDSLVALADFSVPELINRVNDEDEDVQYWVLKTLKAIGRPALPDIIRLLKRGTDEQRFFAAKALGLMRDPLSTDPLLEALSDGHEWVRLYAAIALGELGETRAVGHLVKSFADPAFKVHAGIYRVFEKFGAAAVAPLLAAVRSQDPTTMKNALRVLGRLRDEPAFETIREFLAHPSDELKLAAVDAVACYRERPDVVRLLAAQLVSSPDKVRSRIHMALAEVGSEEGIVEMIRSMLLVENEREKKTLTDLVVRLAERAAPVLVGLLGADRVPVRRVAAELLTRIGEKVRPFVQKALERDDKNVRYWAAKIVRALNEKQVLE